MPVRPIVRIGHPALRTPAQPVALARIGHQEVQALIDDMVETMRAAPGVGLAAPQIAVPLRLVVVEYGESDEEGAPRKLYVVINPELTHASVETEIGNEACLSVPGLAGKVERPQAIVIKGCNRRGRPIRLKARGWLARIFLHEIDHTDGILYVDRASEVWKVEERPEQVVPAD